MRLFYRAFLVGLGLAASGALAFEKFASLENLNLRLGAFELRIPRLAVENTPLTKEALAAIFASGATPPLAERLARFSAGRARIPEAQAESVAGGGNKSLKFNDMQMDAVVAGRVGALRLGSLEERLRDNRASAVARYENMSANGLDLPRFAGLFAGESAPAGLPALADAAALEKLAVSAGEGGVSLTAARLSTRRPRIGALPEKGESRSEGEIVNDILQTIAFETLEAHDLALTGREAPAEATYAIGARDLAFDGLDKGVARKARLAGYNSQSADGGRLRVEALAFEGLDIGAALTQPRLRALHFDKARIERLAGDAPSPDGKGRVKFALASGALDLGNFRDGAPTKALARFQGLSVDLAARGEDPSAAFLRGLGYSTLELAGAADAQWVDARRELEVSKLSLEARDMFALSLRLKFSHVRGRGLQRQPARRRVADDGRAFRPGRGDAFQRKAPRSAHRAIGARERRRSREAARRLRPRHGPGHPRHARRQRKSETHRRGGRALPQPSLSAPHRADGAARPRRDGPHPQPIRYFAAAGGGGRGGIAAFSRRAAVRALSSEIP